LYGLKADFVLGTFLAPSDEEKARGFVGYSWETLLANMGPGYAATADTGGRQSDFFSVFSVFFPAVTGISAGANLSGDLKEPNKAIPRKDKILNNLRSNVLIFFNLFSMNH